MATLAPAPAPRQSAPAARQPARSDMARSPPRAATPFGGALQAKLALGPVNDAYERQADAAAAHVVARRPGAPQLTGLPGAQAAGVTQRACAACEEKEKARVQRKCACGGGHDGPCTCEKKEEEHPELQIDRKANGAPRAAPDPVGAVDAVIRGPGRPLPEPVRRDMEAGFGRPFGHVRIHDGPRAAASADGIGAHAYTVGNHIAFNRGQYRPGSDSGRFLLAHELAHTVQQSGAPAAERGRISQPGDAHEAQANRAAHAATSGGAVPALTAGAAPISRYGASDAAGDAAEALTYFYGGPVIGYVFGDDANAAASDLAEGAIDFASDAYRTALAIAEQLGVEVSIEGTTLVISYQQFDPCDFVDLDFALQLSDIGLDPTLYFPLGPPVPFFTVGIVTLAGMAGIKVNLDPGLGLRADACSFGPGQIRIDPLAARADISGALSFDVTAMNQFGGDLALSLDTVAIIAWPDPPIVLMVPAIGAVFGGSLEVMLQGRTDFSGQLNGSASLGGVSAALNLKNELTLIGDMSYGLFGAVTVLGQELCRLTWPLDSWHGESSLAFQVAAKAGINSSGLNFSFAASATALPTNPLGDLGFAFDDSRMEDDCRLCDLLFDNNAMPSQNGYTWAGNSGNYPLLGGPERDIMQRDPGITSGALCRGTCGADCADGSCRDEPETLIVCENRGDSHVWHSYLGYQICGSHEGCRDHDACYDMMADTIWGFGGFMLGPGYRACDLDAVCQHGFQTAVGWAGGSGPYDSYLRYADSRRVTPGCLGPCPETQEGAEGEEVQQTCLQDRTLWDGLRTEKRWEENFFSGNLITGSIPVPFVKRLTYGVNGDIRGAADAFAELGPIDLMNACLIYDPATMTYTGTADMTLFANLGASASITGTLDGFLSDPACFLNWITLRGYLNAGVLAQLPTQLTAGVDLYCENGDLMVLPRLSFQTRLQVKGRLIAGLNVYLLSFDVWGREWTLADGTILERPWDMDLSFEPFRVGEMPTFNLESAVGALDALLDQMMPVATPRDHDRTPARNPLPAAPSLLFPCMGDDDDDDDDDDDGPTDGSCTRKATGEDGRRIVPDPEARGPHWPSTSTITIPGGGGTETVGHIMEAPYLEKDVTGGSTPGTQNSIYRHVGLPTAGCFTASKKKPQHFIKGHLLNHNIGGPGRGEKGRKNLFPITEKANADHRDDVEQSGLNVVNRVRADELLYYKVTVQSDLTPREITNPATGVGRGFYEVRATFLCEVTDYQLCDDDTLRRNPIPPATPITSIFEFTPSGGQPFDTITDPAECHERGPL